MFLISHERLNFLRSLTLEKKIEYSTCAINEWYEYHEGQVSVSFSGGLDSTVLLHLVRSIFPNIPAVFVDTGLEFPEVRSFVKSTDNVIWVKPKLSFKYVIERYGYPVVSKRNAHYIYQIRNTKSDALRHERLNGSSRGNLGKLPDKWKYLLDAPFKISDFCCHHLKTGPMQRFLKRSGLAPFVGMKVGDAGTRLIRYLRFGCNAFKSGHPQSNPLSIWSRNDINEYIDRFSVEYSKIYNLGYTKTGCMFCLFGAHKDKFPNRFQQMSQTHPKHYHYCMEALGIRQVLQYMNIPFEMEVAA